MSLLLKIRNKLWSYYNRIVFRLKGVHYGHNLVVHGHIGLRIMGGGKFG